MENKKYIIYAHKNKITNEYYIGQTCSDLTIRSGLNGKKYTYKKKNNEYYHPKFAPAIIQYGWDNFEHIILESDITEDIVDEREKDYIKLYDSVKHGYNATEGGQREHYFDEESRRKMSEAHKKLCGKNSPNYGIKRTEEERKRISQNSKNRKNYKHSEETKQKISKALTGRKLSEETKKKLYPLPIKYKIVYQYDLNGNFIQKFDSITAALVSLNKGGTKQDRLSNHCKTKTPYNGYYWSFEKVDKFIPIKKIKSNKATHITAVDQYDLNGNFIAHYDIMKFAADAINQKTTANIRKCINGERKQCGGYIWKESKKK